MANLLEDSVGPADGRDATNTAGSLFRQRGFDEAGVADIMKGVGLTHGGFYGHFDSKDGLTAEATSRALRNERWIECRTGAGTLSLENLVRSHLSRTHRDDVCACKPVLSMSLLEQQFFPNADRIEILADITLPPGARPEATEKGVNTLERWLKQQPEAQIVSSYQ